MMTEISYSWLSPRKMREASAACGLGPDHVLKRAVALASMIALDPMV
jgi:hypothetical protein